MAGEASLWPSLTGAETLALLGRVHGRVDLAYKNELIDRFELDPTKRVRAYSKGNHQKVILIAALMVRPDLLIFDEPTSGLDPLMEQAFRLCIAEARDRGQTIFLSSHLMSEVEALCDRVGILRSGKLIEMGTLSEMRHLSALSVEATLDGPIPDLSAIPGVSSVEIEGHVVRCQVRGPIEPLLKVLTDTGVAQLVSREPSLEELFLALYGAMTMLPDIAVRSPASSPLLVERSAGSVVALVTARKAARSGVVWGLVFGLAIASSEISYVKIYTSAAQRDALAAAYGSNKAMSALFGPATQLQTVGGFTAFKISMTLMVLGAVWGLLTSTRLLRGEEDSGRWDLLLAGLTTRRRATALAIGGLGAGAVTLWMTTAVITVLSGRSSNMRIAVGSSLYFALAMAATTVMFLAVGAVTSQLSATRRQAASLGAALLGVSYALRLIADAGVGFHGLIWASPLGWVEELQPLTSPRPLAFLPIVAFSCLACHLRDHPCRKA